MPVTNDKIPVSLRFTEVPYCPVCYLELDPGDSLLRIPDDEDNVVLSCPVCKHEFTLEAHVDIRFSTVSIPRTTSVAPLKGDNKDAVKTVSNPAGGSGGVKPGS